MTSCSDPGSSAHPTRRRSNPTCSVTSFGATRLSGGYVCLESVADPNNKPVGQIEDDGTFFLATVVEGKNLGGVLPGEYKVRVVPPTVDAGPERAAAVVD